MFRPDDLKLEDFANGRVCPHCRGKRVSLVEYQFFDFEGRQVKVLFCQDCGRKCGRVL